MKRGIAYALTFLFGLQSCMIYTKTSVPIQDAVDKGAVKTIDINGNPHKYSRITRDTDSVYYATRYKKTIPLFKEYYGRGVYLKDRKKSAAATWTIAIGLSVLQPFLFYFSLKEAWNGD